ncbi:MAG TPA: M48 family metalloprotease [Geobacterales bacterium]|nr:M48 family metalloprotease [Geobacterales bacterium]
MRQLLGAWALLIFLSGCATTNLPPIGASGKFTPEEDEKRLWKRSEEEQRSLSKSGFLYEDQELESYLNEVARKVQPPELRSQLPIRVRVIKNPYLNAFAFPNGVIYIHTGMLARMDNEAQLATILGHEMSHATYRHSIRSFRHQKNKSAILASFNNTLGSTPFVGGFVSVLGEVGTMASVSGYSSDLETEADMEGLKQLIRAGYDPKESSKIFLMLKEELEDEDISEPFFFGTHPRVKERLHNYEKFLKKDAANTSGGGKNTELFQNRTTRLLLDNALLDLKAGRYKQVRRGAERLLARRPGDARAHYLLGEVARQSDEAGEIPKAVTHFQKAIALNASYAEPYRSLGLIQFKKGERGAARRNLQSYLTLSPTAADREFIEQYLKECK